MGTHYIAKMVKYQCNLHTIAELISTSHTSRATNRWRLKKTGTLFSGVPCTTVVGYHIPRADPIIVTVLLACQKKGHLVSHILIEMTVF